MLEVGDISYTIGAQGLLNVGEYIFEEDPVCNYEEIVTLTNLPAFTIHNEASSDFDLPFNNDNTLIGSYVVTIRSEISVPDDYTQTTFTAMFSEYEFKIFIQPCIVSTYFTTL